MNFRVWIIEASGKTKAFKAALAKAGHPKDRVLATFGRLMDLADDLGHVPVEMASNPELIPWKELREGQIGKLLQMCRGASEVMLATDSDLEGELIAHHLGKFISKEGIALSRVSIAGISPEHLKWAMKNKSSINSWKVEAATSRRLFDRHLGFELVTKEDHFAMSMGRVISPLIQSLTERPPITTRIECELEDGWKAVFRLPNYLSVQAETLCGILSAIEPVSIDLTSTQRIVVEKKPLIGPEAILLCANKLEGSIGKITETLQESYMAGEISYPRTDSRKMGEIAIKWAQRVAEKAGVPFSRERAEARQGETLDRSFDAHEAIIPLTDRMSGKDYQSSYISAQDKVLAVLTEHSAQLGNKPVNLLLEQGSIRQNEQSAKWTTLTRGYLKHMSLERVRTEDGIIINKSIDGIHRKPTFHDRRVKMWRDTPDLVAARRMVEIGLGRPSTLGIIAEKAAKNYLTDFAEINGRGRLMLHKVLERCPLLLKDGVARQIEGQLVGVTERSSVANRLDGAWQLLRQRPLGEVSSGERPTPSREQTGPENDVDHRQTSNQSDPISVAMNF